MSSSAEDELMETQPIKRKVKVPSTKQVKEEYSEEASSSSKTKKHREKETQDSVPSSFLKKNQKTLVKKKLRKYVFRPNFSRIVLLSRR